MKLVGDGLLTRAFPLKSSQMMMIIVYTGVQDTVEPILHT